MEIQVRGKNVLRDKEQAALLKPKKKRYSLADFTPVLRRQEYRVDENAFFLRLQMKTIPGDNAREHWRVKAARMKVQRLRVKEYCGDAIGKRMTLPITITLTRISAGVLDDDNLCGALKAVRDGLADVFGLPDNSKLFTFHYAQATCPRGEAYVEIVVQERKG